MRQPSSIWAPPWLASRGGSVTVVRFDTVPDQMPLGSAAGMQSPDDLEFEERMEQFKDDLDVSLDYGEIVSHAPGHAVVNFADHHNTDLMIVEGTSVGVRSWVRGSEIEWIARHVHCDLLLFHPSRFEGLRRIVLVTDNGPFDPSKVEIGDALAQHVGARLVLTHTIPPDATDDHRATLQKYHDQLTTLCSVPTDSRFLETDRPVDIADDLNDDDLLVVGSDDSWWNRLLDKRQSHRIVEAFDGPSLVVRAHRETSPGPVERLVERFAL